MRAFYDQPVQCQERLRLDKSLLEQWADLERHLPDGVKLPFERAAVIARFEANGRAVMEVSGAALGIAMKFKGEGGWPTNPMGKFWASRPGMGVY